MADADPILAEQISYYEARAKEYDDWFYRRGRYDGGAEHTARWQAQVEAVRSELHALPPRGRVLEFASGTGLWTAELAKHDVEITAVDSSSGVHRLNRARLGDSHVRYVQADIFEWQPTGQYDTILFTFWLSHVPPERFDAFWELVRDSLAPGGRVFFVDSRWRPDYHWPHGTPVDDPSDPQPAWLVNRELNDGRSFNIVKVFYQPSVLLDRLSELGWSGTVADTPDFFIWGKVHRATDP